MSGNRDFPEHELLAFLAQHDLHFTDLKSGEGEQLVRSQQLLKLFYQDQDYLLAEVRAGVPPHLFTIVEGPRISSIEVNLQGNVAFQDRTLRRLLGDSPQMSRIQEGMEKIRKLYRDRGYLLVELKGPAIEVMERAASRWLLPIPGTSTGFRAILGFSIHEGPRFRIGRVQLPVLPAELKPGTPQRGSFYSESELAEFQEKIRDHFRKNGRLLSDFQIHQRIDTRTDSVDLQVSLRVLPSLSIRTIEFTGHSVFPDSFYRRELKLQEGEILDSHRLEESLEALRKTGTLESLRRDHVELLVHEDAGEADLILRLDEKDRQRVDFSVGPDGLHNLETSFVYTLANLLGMQEKLGLRVNLGSKSSELALGVAARYLVGSSLPVDLALHFFRRSTGFRLPGLEEPVQRLFSHKSRGMGGSIRFRFSPAHELTAYSSLEQALEPEPGLRWVVPPSSEYRKRMGRSTQLFRAGQRFSVFESSTRSWSWATDLGWETHLGPSGLAGKQPFRLRGRASWVRFFGNRDLFAERLLLDPEGPRGFSRSSGPWGTVADELVPIGGDSRFGLSGEYEGPLKGRVRLVPFADVGILYSRAKPVSADLVASTNRVWRSSLGTEFRIRPVKRLPATRLILAWNPLRLDRRVWTPKGIAHLRDPAFSFRVRF